MRPSRYAGAVGAAVLTAAVAIAGRAQQHTPEPRGPIPASCAPVVYKPAGTPSTTHVLRGPGLLLEGAGADGSPAYALHWLRAHIGASQSGRAGNVVVLQAAYDDAYTRRFYAIGKFAWVQEILIPPCASRAKVDAMARYVNMADAVYFVGGDQANYAAWRGSALIAAVKRVYARGGFVGGGSAGLAIQGDIAYDSVAADRLHPHDDDYEVKSLAALADPLMPEISFTHLFSWPALANTITDTHFKARDRFGRLTAFIARIIDDKRGPVPYYGLGIDQGSEVLVEPDGTATLCLQGKSNGVIFVRGGAVKLRPGRPLDYTVAVARVSKNGARFDLLHHRPGVPWTEIRVRGGVKTPYSRNPYAL